MASVKDHYQNHLASIYSWMSGDLETGIKKQEEFFRKHELTPHQNTVALDLGAGHGIQSIALARLGFEVTAIDFNAGLLEELQYNAHDLKVKAVQDDIKNVSLYDDIKPSLIVCAGDTLTHLAGYNEIEKLLEDCCDTLLMNGKLFLSFRDYSVSVTGDHRFIPVKSDDQRILTCFLEYQPAYVNVTDLLYEKDGETWKQKVSSYKKFRITDEEVMEILSNYQMKIISSESVKGIITIIAQK